MRDGGRGSLCASLPPWVSAPPRPVARSRVRVGVSEHDASADRGNGV